MRKTMRASWFATFAGLLTVGLGFGCDPPIIVPSAAPGRDYHEAAPEQKVDEAAKPQALGETGRSLAASTRKPPIADLVPAPPTEKGEVKTIVSGIQYETIKPGKGETVKAGQMVTIHYTGKLENGDIFDSSRKPGRTEYTTAIGVGDMIPGWDRAVPGMKVGEVRKLIVPPNAGYGAQGKPPTIPPNATLYFEVEVLSTKD